MEDRRIVKIVEVVCRLWIVAGCVHLSWRLSGDEATRHQPDQPRTAEDSSVGSGRREVAH